MNLGCVYPAINERCTDGEGTPVTKAPVILFGTDIIGETGHDQFTPLAAGIGGDFKDLGILCGTYLKTVEAKIDRGKLSRAGVGERGATLPAWQGNV